MLSLIIQLNLLSVNTDLLSVNTILVDFQTGIIKVPITSSYINSILKLVLWVGLRESCLCWDTKILNEVGRFLFLVLKK